MTFYQNIWQFFPEKFITWWNSGRCPEISYLNVLKNLEMWPFNWFALKNAIQKKLPVSKEFISAFTEVLHWSLSLLAGIHSTISDPIYFTYILTLSSQLLLLSLGSLRVFQIKFRVYFDKPIFQVFRIYAWKNSTTAEMILMKFGTKDIYV